MRWAAGGTSGIFYDRAFSNVFIKILGGNDKVTITGTPPATSGFKIAGLWAGQRRGQGPLLDEA